MYKTLLKPFKNIRHKAEIGEEDGKEEPDVFLYEYESYDDYRAHQIFHNKRKLTKVWADKRTLDEVARSVKARHPNGGIKGLCHGARNGFEQAYFADAHQMQVIGTDISPTANDFRNSVEWDFHEEREDWLSTFDFIYSNSLDQAQNPRRALVTWLNQIHQQGQVIIEHTKAHGPDYAGAKDPFGVRPQVMPYVLADWFGHQISVAIKEVQKDNMDMKAWLFSLRKHVQTVE